MSDYVDENFEQDETDEFWGVKKGVLNTLTCKQNETRAVSELSLFLNEDWILRRHANYQYVDPIHQRQFLELLKRVS